MAGDALMRTNIGASLFSIISFPPGFNGPSFRYSEAAFIFTRGSLISISAPRPMSFESLTKADYFPLGHSSLREEYNCLEIEYTKLHGRCDLKVGHAVSSFLENWAT